jgi:cupin 2 domain-containing protein
VTGEWRRGQLGDGAAAPELGESVERLLERNGVVVEHILSGTLPEPVDYRQEHDEWVVLLAGRAKLVVAGEDLDLNAGDWLFLPAGVPHRLVATAPGSSWLAVHLPAG